MEAFDTILGCSKYKSSAIAVACISKLDFSKSRKLSYIQHFYSPRAVNFEALACINIIEFNAQLCDIGPYSYCPLHWVEKGR